MILSYNLSPVFKDYLDKIDTARIKILLTPLSPSKEIRFKWEATVSKVYWSLSLSENPLSKNKMAKILANSSNKLKKIEKEVISYKNALNYISREWLANPREMSISSLNTICNIANNSPINTQLPISPEKKKDLKTLFDYLHTGTEHPLLQAGIALISLINIAPYEKGSGKIARLIPYVYLYKNGYDLRGFLVLDEFMRRDLVGLNHAANSVTKNQNLNLWLEYYLNGTLKQILNSLNMIENSKFTTETSSQIFKLNNRQQEIFELFDVPDVKITNKIIQKKFKVSQITASRDLAKLAKLNLILSYGKGRSTFYTKA